MPDLDVVALIDRDLSPLHTRYMSLAQILRQPHLDPEHLLPFLDDVNQQFDALLQRLECQAKLQDQPEAAS